MKTGVKSVEFQSNYKTDYMLQTYPLTLCSDSGLKWHFTSHSQDINFSRIYPWITLPISLSFNIPYYREKVAFIACIHIGGFQVKTVMGKQGY